jgi:hypothetical protein
MVKVVFSPGVLLISILPPWALHDIVGDTQPQPGSLCALFGGEERLQDFVFDLVGDARAVVFDFDGDALVFLAGAYGETGLGW